MKKIIFWLLIGISLHGLAWGASSASGVASGNITNIIDLKVITANALPDVRAVDVKDLVIVKLVINNNSEHGYTLKLRSENGAKNPENAGYLMYVEKPKPGDLAKKTSTSNALIAGTRPQEKYKLSVLRDDDATKDLAGQYGTEDGDTREAFSLDKEHIISYGNSSKSTIQAVYNVLMNQAADSSLYHGEFDDQIMFEISDQ